MSTTTTPATPAAHERESYPFWMPPLDTTALQESFAIGAFAAIKAITQSLRPIADAHPRRGALPRTLAEFDSGTRMVLAHLLELTRSCIEARPADRTQAEWALAIALGIAQVHRDALAGLHDGLRVTKQAKRIVAQPWHNALLRPMLPAVPAVDIQDRGPIGGALGPLMDARVQLDIRRNPGTAALEQQLPAEEQDALSIYPTRSGYQVPLPILALCAFDAGSGAWGWLVDAAERLGATPEALDVLRAHFAQAAAEQAARTGWAPLEASMGILTLMDSLAKQGLHGPHIEEHLERAALPRVAELAALTVEVLDPAAPPADLGSITFHWDAIRRAAAERRGEKRPISLAALHRATGFHPAAIKRVVEERQIHPAMLGPICAALGCEPGQAIVWAPSGVESSPPAATDLRDVPADPAVIKAATVRQRVTDLIALDETLRPRLEATKLVRKGRIAFLVNGYSANIDPGLLCAMCAITGKSVGELLKLTVPEPPSQAAQLTLNTL